MNYQSEIFPVSPTDRKRIVEVWENSVRATHHFISEDDIDFFRPLVREAIEGDIELACIRDIAGEAIGFVGVVEGTIEMLFVHSGWHGQGVGRLLLEHAVGPMGATKVDVNEQNEEAVGFYKRLGFCVQGRCEVDSTGKPYPLLHMKLG